MNILITTVLTILAALLINQYYVTEAKINGNRDKVKKDLYRLRFMAYCIAYYLLIVMASEWFIFTVWSVIIGVVIGIAIILTASLCIVASNS